LLLELIDDVFLELIEDLFFELIEDLFFEPIDELLFEPIAELLFVIVLFFDIVIDFDIPLPFVIVLFFDIVLECVIGAVAGCMFRVEPELCMLLPLGLVLPFVVEGFAVAGPVVEGIPGFGMAGFAAGAPGFVAELGIGEAGGGGLACWANAGTASPSVATAHARVVRQMRFICGRLFHACRW
jgi:hypothetical protein